MITITHNYVLASYLAIASYVNNYQANKNNYSHTLILYICYIAMYMQLYIAIAIQLI